MCFDTGPAIFEQSGEGRVVAYFIGARDRKYTLNRPDDRPAIPHDTSNIITHLARSTRRSLSHNYHSLTLARSTHRSAQYHTHSSPINTHYHIFYRRSSALLAATLAPRCPSSCPTTGGPRIGCPAGGDGPLWLITLPGLSTDINSLACSLAAAAAAARCA